MNTVKNVSYTWNKGRGFRFHMRRIGGAQYDHRRYLGQGLYSKTSNFNPPIYVVIFYPNICLVAFHSINTVFVHQDGQPGSPLQFVWPWVISKL